MNILRASREHGPSIAPLFDAYRQFYGQPSDLPACEAFLAERFVKADSVIFLAVDKAGKPQGFTQLYPSFSSVSMERLWILNDLFVVPEGRRSGVALKLLRRAEQFARETKSKGLVLETAIDNQPAKSLYKKAGWRKEEEFDRYVLTFS